MATATATKKAKARPIGTAKPKASKASQKPKAKLPHKAQSYTLKFAMFSAPVILYTAAREEKVELHQYHRHCMKQIKRLGNFCPDCAGLGEKGDAKALDQGLTLKEVRLGDDDMVKGFDAGDRVIPITEEEIDGARPDSAQVLEIMEFVDESEIDAITFDASFYLAADLAKSGANGVKVYALLRVALDEEKKIAVARMVKSRHEYLAFIKPYGSDGLILYTAYMADEVREMAFPELPALRSEEIKAGCALINQMTNEWNPSKYEDGYRKNLNALIEAKKEGVEPPKVERKPATTVGDDLMATLKASLAMMKKSA